MGSLRGRPRRGRLPSGLDSENGFLAEGPLEGPGATEQADLREEVWL